MHPFDNMISKVPKLIRTIFDLMFLTMGVALFSIFLISDFIRGTK